MNSLTALGRSRVPIAVVLLLYAGLSATPQAADLLIALGQDGAPLAWAGFGLGLGWLGYSIWFWTGYALSQPVSGGRLAAALPWLLAAAGALAVADALRGAASAIPAIMGQDGGAGRLLLVAGLLAMAVIVLLGLAFGASVGGRVAGLGRGRLRSMVAISFVLGSAGLVAFAVDPVWAGRLVSPTTIVLFASAGLVSGGTWLREIGLRTRVPALFLMLALAGVLAALRDRHVLPDNHALHVLARTTPRPGVEDAFLRFLHRPEAGEEPQTVILVAASGGGIAAAFWTATVLGDLADHSPLWRDSVFAMSGVSGGSVGLTAYTAGRAEAGCSLLTRRACLQAALSGDFLAPALGAALYPDLLQRFLPVLVTPDRAAALEGAWAAEWRRVYGQDRLAEPFQRLWPAEPWPALLLNTTAYRSGGRLIVSNLALQRERIGGDDADLLARLGGDLSAVTAQGAGARFPFIGPLGTFQDGASQDGAVWDAVADGGYFENLGASTLLELLNALDALAREHAIPVRFIVLQVVSDPEAGNPAPESDWTSPWALLPRGLTGPATVLLHTREARGIAASEALARQVAVLGGSYVPVRLGRTPTGQAAPLGWSLSAVARAAIDRQWTLACRNRVLAAIAGMDREPAPSSPQRMDVMAMWQGGTCHALEEP